MTSDTANIAANEDASPSPRAGSPLEVLLSELDIERALHNAVGLQHHER